MGRKTGPILLRISAITRTWDPKWFADRPVHFRHHLTQDLRVRSYLDRVFKQASISRVEITRDQKEIVLTIHTSRPAVVIGRGGSGIEKIQKDLKPILGGMNRVRINVQEIANPDTDAAAIATQVVDQLERRMPYRRVLKQVVGRTMQSGAVGVRVAVGGRLNGSDIARREWLAEGNVPLHTFRADISFAKRTAHTTYGTIGVKVWVNRGDLKLDEVAENRVEVKARKPQAQTRRRRKSLADVAKTPQVKKAAK